MPRKFLHISILLLFAASVVIGQPAQKTLVKSFNLQGNQVVMLDLKGTVELVSWNNSSMRVQMAISLKHGTEAMLKSLVKAGRYNLRSTLLEEAYKVHAPALQKKVLFHGKVLEEAISFIIFTPEDILVKLPGEASSGLGDGNMPPSL